MNTDQMVKSVNQMQHDKNLESAKAEVDLRKKLATEARDAADKAEKHDVSISVNETAESVRLETLATQAEASVAAAQENLKAVQDNKPESETVATSNAVPGVTTTDTVGAKV